VQRGWIVNKLMCKDLLPDKTIVPIIGLLGGVGAGKTTVARAFAARGCAVISADEINHNLLAQDDVIAHLKETFGDDIITIDGKIDRPRLGDIVFSDDAKRIILNDYLHPIICQQALEQIGIAQGNKDCKAIILDIPLLLEVGHEKWCNTLIYIEVTEEIRHQRLLQRSGWNIQKIKNIENSQFTLDKKEKLSDHNLCNSFGLPELGSQVDKKLSLIIKQF
jgi:dephospho-CoA kinase